MNLRVTVLTGATALLASLILARVHPFGNAGLYTPIQSDGNVAAGKMVFEKRCTGCHSLEQNREGPNLRGVFGRPAGSVASFPYSPAMKSAHITWNELTLDKWLTDPDAFLPGNNMDFRVAKPQERADLIRYFRETATP